MLRSVLIGFVLSLILFHELTYKTISIETVIKQFLGVTCVIFFHLTVVNVIDFLKTE
jgi:hypothetical protein